MAQEKKNTTAVTVSLSDESLRELDDWRLDQPFSPSRSKVFQQMLNEFLASKRQTEAPKAIKQPVVAAVYPSGASGASGSGEVEKKTKTKAAASAV